eukprot:767451-Hanusia_phi.AAC.10
MRRESLEDSMRAIPCIPSNHTARASVINDILVFLCRHSFFFGGSSKDWKSVLPSSLRSCSDFALLEVVGTLSRTTRSLCVDKLFRLLLSSSVITHAKESNWTHAVASDTLTSPSDIDDLCNQVVQAANPKKIVLETQLSEEDRRRRKSLNELKEAMRSVATDGKLPPRIVRLSREIVQLLSSVSLLQVFACLLVLTGELTNVKVEKSYGGERAAGAAGGLFQGLAISHRKQENTGERGND